MLRPHRLLLILLLFLVGGGLGCPQGNAGDSDGGGDEIDDPIDNDDDDDDGGAEPVLVDFDRDGVDSTEDCNDRDPRIAERIEYFRDRDLDGYGSLESLRLCSLTTGPGLVTNSDDPDDSDPARIPSDVDGDGFANEDDCAVHSSAINEIRHFFADEDRDGYYGGEPMPVCDEREEIEGYSLDNDDEFPDDALFHTMTLVDAPTNGPARIETRHTRDEAGEIRYFITLLDPEGTPTSEFDFGPLERFQFKLESARYFDDRFVLVGEFFGHLDFDLREDVEQIVSSQEGRGRPERDVFIASFALDGALQWVKLYGTTRDDWVASAPINDAGMIYMSFIPVNPNGLDFTHAAPVQVGDSTVWGSWESGSTSTDMMLVALDTRTEAQDTRWIRKVHRWNLPLFRLFDLGEWVYINLPTEDGAELRRFREGRPDRWDELEDSDGASLGLWSIHFSDRSSASQDIRHFLEYPDGSVAFSHHRSGYHSDDPDEVEVKKFDPSLVEQFTAVATSLEDYPTRNRSLRNAPTSDGGLVAMLEFNGNLLIEGESLATEHGADFPTCLIYRVDANGKLLWSREFDSLSCRHITDRTSLSISNGEIRVSR